MTNQFCSSCGEKIASEKNFCSNCGKATRQVEQHLTPDITETSVAPQAATQATNKKWIYVGIAAAIAVFAYFFFINAGPEKVAKDFMSHYGSYEFEKVQKLLSTDEDTWLYDEIDWILEEKRDYPEEFQEGLSYAKEEGYIIKNFTILDNVQTKHNSSITGRVTLENGDRETVYIELVKESGKWKVYDVD